MTVHFIGAGPGAADLITVRGRDLIARCPVCLYAGSIVPRELLAHCPPGARIVDTAPLSLDEIEAEFVAAHASGLDVARLHSGDLSIYSALAEQLRRLERRGIPYTLTPGVPAFAAAAAALRVRTDRAGSRAERGADPHLRPRLAHAGKRETRDVRRERRDARHPSRDPCHRDDRGGADAVLRRRLSGRGRGAGELADERILRGTLADIAAKVAAARIERTALILVGRALARRGFPRQRALRCRLSPPLPRRRRVSGDLRLKRRAADQVPSRSNTTISTAISRPATTRAAVSAPPARPHRRARCFRLRQRKGLGRGVGAS